MWERYNTVRPAQRDRLDYARGYAGGMEAENHASRDHSSEQTPATAVPATIDIIPEETIMTLQAKQQQPLQGRNHAERYWRLIETM
jgi:hypothetical protein